MSLSIFRRHLSIALALLAHLHDVFSQSQPNTINEICNGYNGRRIYLDLGEHGVLQASHVVVPGYTNVNIFIVKIVNYLPVCVLQFNLVKLAYLFNSKES